MTPKTPLMLDISATTTIREMALMAVEDGHDHVATARYLQAMLDSGDAIDPADFRSGHNGGAELVTRFVVNAKSWRGDTARAVKAELRRRLTIRRAAMA